MPGIGIDAGTSAVKAVLFDDDWACLRTATRAVDVQRPHPGWSEQDPDAVWAAVVAVVREVADGARVDSLSVTAQGDGCWLIDEAGRPVRAAMLWNDARATGEVDRWDGDGLLDEAFDRTGSWGFAGLAHAQLAWLAAHEPHVVAAADTLLSCGSWLFLQLTGRRALEVSDASNPFLAADGSGYAVDLLDRLGLAWVQPLLPEVVRGPARVSELGAAAADALGLPAGVPVVLAPYDVVTTAIGSGAIAQTSAMAVLGTTLAVGVVVPDAQLGRERSGSALDLGLDGRWMLLYGTLAGTEVLAWTQRLLGLASVAALVDLAGTAEPGRGPLVLPYLSPGGERTPFRDPLARGAVLGLDLEQRPADVARGVLEGLTLAVADCLRASGRRPSTVAVSGGGARSDLWCQLLADACGAPVERGTSDQIGALGASLAAAVELGRYAGIDDAVRAAVVVGRVFEPDADQVTRLSQAAERYRAARATGAHRA